MGDAIDLSGLSADDAEELRALAARKHRRTANGIAADEEFSAVGPFGSMRWRVSDLPAQGDLYSCMSRDAHYDEVDGKRFQHLSIWADFSADEIRAGRAKP